MQRPTFLEGVGIALLISLITSPLAALLHLWVGGFLGVAVFVVTLTYLYIVYLLARSRKTTGRMTLAGLSAVLLSGSLVLPAPWVGLSALALMAAMRACAYSRSICSSLLHGLLCLFGLGVALWAYRQSGSLFLTVWSFFLLQALFVYIPAHLPKSQEAPVPGEDPFSQAHQAAQQALARLRSGPVS